MGVFDNAVRVDGNGVVIGGAEIREFIPVSEDVVAGGELPVVPVVPVSEGAVAPFALNPPNESGGESAGSDAGVSKVAKERRERRSAAARSPE